MAVSRFTHFGITRIPSTISFVHSALIDFVLTIFIYAPLLRPHAHARVYSYRAHAFPRHLAVHCLVPVAGP